MRIAFFHELPPGGARIVINEIAQRIKKDHTIDLYYTDNTGNKNENDNFSSTHFFKFVPKSWKGKNFKARLYKDSIELIRVNNLHKKIAKIIDSKKYDLVFVNASKFVEAPFILKYLKTKKIFYLHDPHFRIIYESLIGVSKSLDTIRATYEKFHRRVLSDLDKQNIKKADFLLANSKYTKNQTYKTYQLRSKVAYLGVDTNFFKPAKIIKRDIDVLYIGSHDILDGYDIFNKSIDKLDKNIKIETLLKDEEWLSQEKVRELYRRSKIILCLGRNEPFGLIPLEAGACEVVAIAISEGGYPETIIDGKTGFLVSTNPKKIIQKINYVLKHPQKRVQIGQEARRNIVKNWEWNVRIAEFKKILTAAANK